MTASAPSRRSWPLVPALRLPALSLPALLLSLLLGACQPLMRTQYSFEPPANDQVKACVAQCDQASALCHRTCQQQAPNCNDPVTFPPGRLSLLGTGRTPGMTLAQFGGIGGPDLDCTDLEPLLQSGRQCEESCDQHYRQCYSRCGGTVTARPVCVAFCN